MSDASSVLTEALEVLRSGESHRAEAIARQAVEDTAPDTAERAAALFDLGTVQLAMGEVRRATGNLRGAAHGRGVDVETKLTYLMNLGEVLTHQGEWDEATSVLEEGLAGREAHYGKDHPGYAYGLEPLADLLLRRGAVDRAAELSDEAAQIFWDSGHPRVTALLVLRAVAHKAAHGVGEPTLEALDRLPAELWDEVIQQALILSSRYQAKLIAPMLLELRGRVIGARGASDPASIDLGIALSNAAREAGDQGLRVRVFRDLVKALSADPRRHLEALLGLGLALSDAGEAEEALSTYQSAVAAADELGDARVQAITNRNAGLYLADQEHASAEAHLRRSVDLATGCGDEDILARSQIALGIFVQHQGGDEEAAALLEAGLAALPVGDPDRLTAHSHLRAIREGGPCGCGDMDASISAALRELVLPEAPEGLLEDITWGPEGVQVVLTRQPTHHEVEALDKLVRQAVELTQGRIRAAGSSRL